MKRLLALALIALISIGCSGKKQEAPVKTKSKTSEGKKGKSKTSKSKANDDPTDKVKGIVVPKNQGEPIVPL